MESSSLTDRRPIALRRLALFHRLAKTLAARGISPNRISVWSIYAAAFAALMFFLTTLSLQLQPLLWICGVIGVQLRLLANLLDGMVAVEHGKASPTGMLYNEVPDRISDTLIFLGMGYAFGGSPTLGLTAALFAISTAYVRALGKSIAGYQEFCGPMAKQQRMFFVTCCALVCAFGPPAYCAFTVFGYETGLPALTLLVITIGSAFTAGRRLTKIAAAISASAQ